MTVGDRPGEADWLDLHPNPDELEIQRLRAQVARLRVNVQEVLDRLNTPRLSAMKVWPPGANGPLAVNAYEGLAKDVRWGVDYLKAALADLAKPTEPTP